MSGATGDPIDARHRPAGTAAMEPARDEQGDLPSSVGRGGA